jgi:hypothetical protein
MHIAYIYENYNIILNNTAVNFYPDIIFSIWWLAIIIISLILINAHLLINGSFVWNVLVELCINNLYWIF